MKKKLLVVGVTGGIGSGKSEVCRTFQRLGVPRGSIVSADDIAKTLMETRETLKKELRAAFGTAVYHPNGTLDRQYLAELVFSDPLFTRRINAIVHPHVLAELRQRILRDAESSKSPFLLVEAALLFQSGADAMMDYVIVVDADEETRMARALRRGDMSRSDFLRRANAQGATKEKVGRADFVVVNNGSLRDLADKVGFLYKLIVSIGRG